MTLSEYLEERKQSLLTTKAKIEENAEAHGYRAATTDAVLCLRSRLEEIELLKEWMEKKPPSLTREERIESAVAGFIKGWFGSTAAFVTPEEMVEHINKADNHEMQFIHHLLCKLHNLMVIQQIYMGMDNAEIGDH